jgi:cytoskeletal protein CcmA (bactofilin family)
MGKFSLDIPGAVCNLYSEVSQLLHRLTMLLDWPIHLDIQEESRMLIRREENENRRERNHDQEGVNTIVNRGTLFEGKADVEGDMLIEGEVHGEVICSDRLTVGQDGTVEANLRAQDIVIAGTVTGEIEAEHRATLRSTAQLQGRLKAKVLVVEEGAALRAADCDIGESRPDWPKGA